MPEHDPRRGSSAHTSFIPQAAPGLRIARHRDEIDAAIARVLAGGRYILGEEGEAFEEEFARFVGAPFAIGVNSGTDALSLALLALGVAPGDEVIVPALTAAATAVAVQRIGAVVRFVDVEPVTRGIDPAALAGAISSRTAAVVVVHLHGTPARLAELRGIAAARGLAVIEDCAHAHGATIDGRMVGTLADAAAFSFYPTKNLGALGDAGAVVVRKPEDAERVRRLRNTACRRSMAAKAPRTRAVEGPMKIDLYTILWNEEEMLPFFFRHYDPIVDRYIVYDDGSTDRTLEMLAAHPRVEVRPFVRTVSDSYVLSALALHDNVWKESRGRADWVILTAVDEHLYHCTGLGWYLQTIGWRGVTAVPALAFQMVADDFPFADEHLATTRRRGVALDHYNKLSVFNPNAVTETRYAVGRHTAAPEGDIRYPAHDRLLLFHYKFLGMDYLVSRYALLSRGLGQRDKGKKWGVQYDLPRGDLEAEFARLRAAAFDVTGRTSRKLVRQKWWRP